MDVQTIARLAGLPVRKIRYVIDQRLLPGLHGQLQTQRVGQPRSFTTQEGYFIACAAVLLQGGAQRKLVTELLSRLVDIPWPLPWWDGPPPTPRQRVTSRP